MVFCFFLGFLSYNFSSKGMEETNSENKKHTKYSIPNSTLNNLTHYSRIFSKKHQNSLLYLKKTEFDIFYSTKYKYPLLVAETITSLTGKTDPNETPIDRRVIEDSFRPDMDIPLVHQYTREEYKKYMEYGGSMGHNAPAGQHKTNLEVYHETFQFSNITPQEIVFNSGLWVLMENWCKLLGQIKRISRVMIFTGSIPNKHIINLDRLKMNIPEKMFKIVCLELNGNPNTTYMEILVGDNKPYYVNHNIIKFDLSRFLLHSNSYESFLYYFGINLNTLLEYYGFNVNVIKPFRKHIHMEIVLTPALKLLMKKSTWFGYLIYAPSLEVLERKWNECKKLETEFQNISFHEEYYEFTKKRFLEHSDSKSDSRKPEFIIKSLTKNITPYTIKKSHTRLSLKRLSPKRL